jgi:hypothetical protein
MLAKPMRILYLILPAMIIALANSSCSSSFGNTAGDFAADTVVAVKTIKHITVQTTVNDSSSKIVNYWTDQDGRPLFKKSEEYMVNGSLDGFQRRWDENGRLIYEAQWSFGMPVEYLQEYHGNGQLKKMIYYNKEKGYPDYEVNFHANGTLRTDTILYADGKREGIINYYTDQGNLKESHIYANDSLIRIKIYNEEYERLVRMVENLKRSMGQDSINRLKRDSLFAALLDEIEDTGTKSIQWKDDYNKLEELKYLEGLLGRLEDSLKTKKAAEGVKD